VTVTQEHSSVFSGFYANGSMHFTIVASMLCVSVAASSHASNSATVAQKASTYVCS